MKNIIKFFKSLRRPTLILTRETIEFLLASLRIGFNDEKAKQIFLNNPAMLTQIYNKVVYTPHLLNDNIVLFFDTPFMKYSIIIIKVDSQGC